MNDWRSALADVETATGRLLRTLSRLTDTDMRAPSLLPGWTRGHLTTHVARNADSLCRLLEWARTGREIPQYDSLESRDADIEQGSRRSAAAMRVDVLDSAERFAAQAKALPEPAWTATVRAMAGWEHPAWYLVYRRWREVEAHHVDLGLGYDYLDWPESYVQWDLKDTLASLRAHGLLAVGRVRATDLDVEVRVSERGPDVQGRAYELLGWLSGRTDSDGLSSDGPLPVPPPWPGAPAL